MVKFLDVLHVFFIFLITDPYNYYPCASNTINICRSYYRCTNKSQGCQATKQVQRSSNDPSIFEVIYRGTHICPRLPATTATAANDLNGHQPLQTNFQMGLKVKTHELENPKPSSPPRFSLPPPMGAMSTNGIAFSPSPAIVSPVIGTTSSFGSPDISQSNYLGACPVSWLIDHIEPNNFPFTFFFS